LLYFFANNTGGIIPDSAIEKIIAERLRKSILSQMPQDDFLNRDYPN